MENRFCKYESVLEVSLTDEERAAFDNLIFDIEKITGAPHNFCEQIVISLLSSFKYKKLSAMDRLMEMVPKLKDHKKGNLTSYAGPKPWKNKNKPKWRRK
jgi:hypothetical protein